MSGQLDLQIKSTTRASARDQGIIYDLEVKNYDDLGESGDNCPRYLVVLVLPEDETQWLSQSIEELVLRHCAYGLSLEGYPATRSKTTVRITIPRANVFPVEAIRQHLVDLRSRRTP